MYILKDNNTTVKEVVSFSVEYHLKEVLKEIGIAADNDLVEKIRQKVLNPNL